MVRKAVAVVAACGLAGTTYAFVVPASRLIQAPATRYSSLRELSRNVRPRTTRALRLSATAEAPEASAVTQEERLVVPDAAPAAVAGEATAAVGEEPAVKKTPLSEIQVGAEYDGVVNNVVGYGAFVDIGADVNGLVHISQLADEFVSDPNDVVKIGDAVKVRTVTVDTEAKKLVLSMRTSPRPARQQSGDVSKYQTMLEEDPTQMMPATVDSIVNFGCFVKLEDGTSGFVHISQIKPPNQRVEKVADVLSVGDAVQVRIRDVDQELKRVNLSLVPLADLAPYAERAKDVSGLVSLDRSVFRKGTVSAVMAYGLFVNIEGVDGLLHISKIREDNSVTAEELKEKYTIGQEVEARILDVDTKLNKMSLTMLPLKEEADYERFNGISPEEWLEGEVVSTTDYGAFVHLGHGVDGMVHISQLGTERVNNVKDAVQIGQTVKVRVIEVNVPGKRVRLTMRDIGDAGATAPGGGERREKQAPRRPKSVAKYLEVGPDEWLEGTVQTLTSFGAFVAVDEDTDGLLHISQISDGRVEAVSDVLTPGQTIKVRVIEVDTDYNRLGLSMREPRQNQRQGGGGRGRGVKKDVSAFADADPNVYVPGKVASIVPYGAFVTIAEGIDGLVHISQLAEGRVNSVADVLSVGDEVQVRVTEVDTRSNTVNLSMIDARSGGGGRRGGGGGGWGGDNEDDFGGSGGGGGRKEKKRGGFNDIAYDAGPAVGGGDGDWQKYLNDYFDKKQ